MAKKKGRTPKDNLEEPKLLPKAEDDQGYISFANVFEPSFTDFNFYRPSYGELESYFYRSPELVALWQSRQSFVSRSLNLTGDAKSPEYKFIHENKDRLNLPELAKKIQRAILFGLSLQEIVWEILPSGKIFPKAFLDLPLSSFNWKNEEVYWNSDTDFKNPIDPRRIVAACYNPLGYDKPFGLMRSLLGPIKAAIENDNHWQLMIKRNTAGILAGFLAKGNDSDEKKTAFTKAGKALQEGKASALGMSNDEKLEWVESKNKGAQSDIYKDRKKYFTDLYAKIIIGATLTTDSGVQASLAIGEVHQNTKEDIAKNDMYFVLKYLNRLMRVIIDMNFANPSQYPQLGFDSLYIVDKARAERDALIAEKMGKRFTDSYISEYHNIPMDAFEKDKREEENLGKK